jgi:hypothetical protein
MAPRPAEPGWRSPSQPASAGPSRSYDRTSRFWFWLVLLALALVLALALGSIL